jgi:hypothetical protein
MAGIIVGEPSTRLSKAFAKPCATTAVEPLSNCSPIGFSSLLIWEDKSQGSGVS